MVKHSTSLGRHPLKERTWGSEGSFAAEEQSGLGHFLEERELIPGGVLTIQSPLHIPWPPLLYCFCWVVRVKIFASKYSTHFWSNGQLFSIMCECRGWIGFFPKSLGESMVRKTWGDPIWCPGIVHRFGKKRPGCASPCCTWHARLGLRSWCAAWLTSGQTFWPPPHHRCVLVSSQLRPILFF